MAMQDIVKIHENDNVAVALRPLAKGETLDVAGAKVSLLEDIPQGHKFALRFIKAAEEVVKYGFRIGYAKEDIEAGAWVHVHNVRTALGDELTYDYVPQENDVAPTEHVYFEGYRRPHGGGHDKGRTGKGAAELRPGCCIRQEGQVRGSRIP